MRMIMMSRLRSSAHPAPIGGAAAEVPRPLVAAAQVVRILLLLLLLIVVFSIINVIIIILIIIIIIIIIVIIIIMIIISSVVDTFGRRHRSPGACRCRLPRMRATHRCPAQPSLPSGGGPPAEVRGLRARGGRAPGAGGRGRDAGSSAGGIIINHC